MIIDPRYQKEIVHILTDIFPGVLIYYVGGKEHESSADSKQPEVDIAIDVGRRIGPKDVAEAQRALSMTHIPYTIFLYDLQSVSEHERKVMIAKAKAWKLGL
jgi:hypothetical protein